MKWWRHVVDLSHPISPEIPVWPGDPRPAFTTLATIAGHGYALSEIHIGEHTGTHVGTAAHLQPGGVTVDQLEPEDLIVPAAVLNVSERALSDPDFTLSVEDVRAWEARHGRVPPDSLVLMATGWDARWPDPTAYLNADDQGVMHFPGFAPQTVTWLVDERRVRGLGIDTPGIDPGRDAGLQSNRRLLRGRHIHLENLTRLTGLPPLGAWVIIGALPWVGRTGSPARVLALIP